MKQRRNGGGCNHRSGQPGMEGHQPGLGKTVSKEKQQHNLSGLTKMTDLSGIRQEIHRHLATIQPNVTPT